MPGIRHELRRPRAVAGEALRRDHVRHEDARREAAVQGVLAAGVLVVVERRAGDAQEPRDRRLLRRAVPDGDGEAAAAREAPERRDPGSGGARLAGPPRSAVGADDDRVEPEARRELDRLRVAPGRHLDRVTARRAARARAARARPRAASS